MNRRTLLRGGTCSLVLGTPKQPFDTRETTLALEVAHVLKLVQQIRSGDLRKSLERDWKQDGGIQVPSPTRYLLRACNNIKIDVECRQVDVTLPFNKPEDIITSVSKPYLEYPVYD